MQITQSEVRDLLEIYRLYDLATQLQKEKFPDNQWLTFDEAMIVQEIEEGRLFKLLIDDDIACVWSISYHDAAIWGKDDNACSIYIHRIATNPEYRGNDYVKIIVAWATRLARKENKKAIRLDTCGKNDRLIAHYKKCGFEFLGIKQLQNADGLPQHYYPNVEVCYFERKIN